MQEHPDIPVGTPAPVANGSVPTEVVAAISRALSDELKAGNTVRIRKLGMWTPYVKGNGEQAVVFHPDTKLLNGLSDLDTERRRETTSNASAVDIPFVDEKAYSATINSQRKTGGPIDVSLIFDEVREEFGIDAPPLLASPGKTMLPDSDSDVSQVKTLVAEKREAEPIDSCIDVEPESQPEEEEMFNRNREQLFNPPLPEPKKRLNIAALVVTFIMAVIIVYLLYVGGLFDGILPQNMQYRQSPVSEINKTRGPSYTDLAGLECQELEVKVFV